MREKIEKLAELNKEAVEFLKTENMDWAIAKHAEIQELIKESIETRETQEPTETPESTESTEPTEPTEPTETSEDIAELEEIKKFVSLNLSADTMKELLDDVASLKDSLKDMSTINQRLDDVENAKGISKQATETVKKNVENVRNDMPF